MKSSGPILMLAILMGLTAWVLDAFIGWVAFPGGSFVELILHQDPLRSLYLRPIVVALFFLFGLVVGGLHRRTEAWHAREQQRNSLLQGVLRLHQDIVGIYAEDELLEVAAREMEKSFGLEKVQFRLLDKERVFGKEEGVEEFRCVMEQVGYGEDYHHYKEFLLSGDLSDVVCCKPTPDGLCLCGALSFQGNLFGLFFAKGSFPPEEHADLREVINSLAHDLGHALARIRSEEHEHRQGRRLKVLYEKAPVGIFSSTFDGRLLFLNESMARMLGGHSPKQVMDACESVAMFYKDPERRQAFLQRVQEDKWMEDFPVELVGLDGKTRSVRFAARMTGDHEGVDPVIEGFTVDETLKVESQEHARLLQEELSRTRRLESITGLAAGVAHEFNNILQAMMGSAYLIQMMAENESSEWQYARDIQDSGTRAARLCEQMLTFAGKKNFTMEVATVDDVIRSSRTKLKSDLKAETSLQIHCRAPEAKVLLDPGSLTEVLVNLVKNAEESVEGREAALEIDTRVVEVSRDLLRTYGIRKHLDPKSYWGLFVSDNGEGITDDVRERMFDPFFTTKFAGRGLGLAAVLGILDKFDGVIGARSLPGSGTEVVVLLPLVSSKAAPDASKASSGLDRTKVSEEAASDWPEDCLVLIVDDEPLICQTIERFVVRWGLRTHSAFDGAEAMDWITHSEQKPHAILLDVTMPRMGGLETIQALNDAQLNIPVILMSGYDENESRRQFQGYELAGFIHKPFQVESLKAELKRVLRSASS